MDVRAQMERIYTELAIEEIPWNLEEPPLAGAGGPHQRCYHVADARALPAVCGR
jgi:hypothetical protein